MVNWGVQVSFIAFASFFKKQGHKTKTALFYTSEIIIFLVHVLFLIGLEDMLEAGLKKFFQTPLTLIQKLLKNIKFPSR